MTTKQHIICLAPGRATPGMTLARAITDREGSILLSSGTALDLACANLGLFWPKFAAHFAETEARFDDFRASPGI